MMRENLPVTEAYLSCIKVCAQNGDRRLLTGVVNAMPGMWMICYITPEAKQWIEQHGLTSSSRKNLSRDHLYPRRQFITCLLAHPPQSLEELQELVRHWGQCAVTLKSQNPGGEQSGHEAGLYDELTLHRLNREFDTGGSSSGYIPLGNDIRAMLLSSQSNMPVDKAVI
jgi:hypothetical protein